MNALTSKLKSKDMLIWRRRFVLFLWKNERLRIHSGLKTIRFDRGRFPEKPHMGTDDRTFQSTSVEILSEVCIQNSFKETG